jgi:hypothetical protein
MNAISMNVEQENRDRCDRVVKTWLLSLLRFAVTRDRDDRQTVLALAAEIDKLGSRSTGNADFSFFSKNGADICAAIDNPDDAAGIATLRQHLDRIEDQRLKRAFAAAVARERPQPRSAARIRGAYSGDLWRGLEPRYARRTQQS